MFVFVGSDLGLFHIFFLGVFLGLLVGLPMYTPRRFAFSFCVPRGALRFFLYNTLLIKKMIRVK